MRIFGFVFILLCLEFEASAQVAEFGNFTEQELQFDMVSFEPEAKNVILFESGDSYFGFGGIHTDYFYRYKVLSDETTDFGDFRVMFFRGDDHFEEVYKVRAEVSYLNGNKRERIRLGKESIKEIDLGDGYFEARIAFPHVKRGSIIEFSYKKVSKILSILDGWQFQGEYPSLVSSFRFKAPSFFQYQMIIQGKRLAEATKVSERSNAYSWTLRNVPSLPNEPFVGSLIDYQERVDGYLFSTEKYKEEELESTEIFYASWNQVAKEILLNDDYRSYLYQTGPNSLLADLEFSDSSKEVIAKEIFNYVSTTYKSIESRWLEPIYPLPRLVEVKRGNSFDKNLLLSYLLRMHDIDSHLIMINERGKGRSQLIEKPYIFQFHSSILKADVDGKTIYLDASDSITPFGLVPLKKLVPRGFFIERENGRLDDLFINHRSGTINQLVFELDDKGNSFWRTTERYSDYSAINWETSYGNLSPDLLLKSDKYLELEVLDLEIENDIKQKRILTVTYCSKTGLQDENTLLLEPFRNSTFFENIFTQNDRLLPVEFEFPSYESFNVVIPIPQGYRLVDYPESSVVTIASKGVKFNFQISHGQNEIKIFSKVEVFKRVFPVEEYPDLKFIMETIADKYMQPIILQKE